MAPLIAWLRPGPVSNPLCTHVPATTRHPSILPPRVCRSLRPLPVPLPQTRTAHRPLPAKTRPPPPTEGEDAFRLSDPNLSLIGERRYLKHNRQWLVFPDLAIAAGRAPKMLLQVREQNTFDSSSSSLLPPPFLFSLLPSPQPAQSTPSPSTLSAMPDAVPQATSSHMMKVTKRGRPYLKVRHVPSLRKPRLANLAFQGHPRSFRHPHRLPRARKPQAVFPHIPKLLHNVRAL